MRKHVDAKNLHAVVFQVKAARIGGHGISKTGLPGQGFYFFIQCAVGVGEVVDLLTRQSAQQLTRLGQLRGVEL